MNIHIFHKKSMENVRKHRDETCQIRKKKRLFNIRTKSSYHKVFLRKLVSNRNEQNWNTYIYLRLLILELSKILMY